MLVNNQMMIEFTDQNIKILRKLIQGANPMKIKQLEAVNALALPKEKERCTCYDNGNKPALLTDFHSGSNICVSCGKVMSSELKVYNTCLSLVKEVEVDVGKLLDKDKIEDIVGCAVEDNALTAQKSERLYYDEDDFGMLIYKIADALITAGAGLAKEVK